MIIALDFDGSCVVHEYPEVGRDIGALPVIEKLVKAGHHIMLWTMRSGKTLDDAVNWFEEKNIPLFGINKNPDQHTWTSSSKQHANIYIDDAALGCPLKKGLTGERPYVDWEQVEILLKERGVI